MISNNTKPVSTMSDIEARLRQQLLIKSAECSKLSKELESAKATISELILMQDILHELLAHETSIEALSSKITRIEQMLGLH